MSCRHARPSSHRPDFGLGVRPGEVARISKDPRAFVLSSLADKAAALIRDPALEPSHVVFANAARATLDKQITKAFGQEGGEALKGKQAAGMTDGMAEAGKTAPMAAGDGMPGPAMTGPETDMKAKAAAADKPAQIRREAFRARWPRASNTPAPLTPPSSSGW